MLKHNSPHPIYHYMYDHMGSLTVAETMLFHKPKLLYKFIACQCGMHSACLQCQDYGAGHGDELLLLFKPSLGKAGWVDFRRWVGKDLDVGKKFLSLLTNFAQHGDPNSSSAESSNDVSFWDPVTPDSRKYMNISTNELKMDNDYTLVERNRLWADIIYYVRQYRPFLSDKMPLLEWEVEDWLKPGKLKGTRP